MDIKETANLSAVITVKDANNNDVNIINLYANLDSSNMSMGINVNTINKTLAADTNNAATIQDQYSQFYSAVQAKAKALGFTIFA